MTFTLPELLTSKIDCLQRLRETAEAFLTRRETWDFADLDRLLMVRTQILQKLQWIDREIAGWMDAELHRNAEERISRLWNDADKTKMKSLSERQELLASLVLTSESQILDAVEARKDELLREKWQGEKARTMLGKFKSKSKPESGEGLDQTL